MIWQKTYCCINKVTQSQNPINVENNRTKLCGDKTNSHLVFLRFLVHIHMEGREAVNRFRRCA